MITQTESDNIYAYAYVPEHLVDYVTSVSDAEPYLFQCYLCYKKDEMLIFIGYPLGESFDEKKMETIIARASKAMKPSIVSLIAPTTVTMNDRINQKNSDFYYQLDLGNLIIPPKVHNMIRRASQEVSVEQSNKWQKMHETLVAEFLSTHQLSEEAKHIFLKIPEYVSSSKSVSILNALNNEGNLIAFDVVDYGSRDYAFYMFNFASKEHYIPGASDLLLSQIIVSARLKGKRFVNLGLAIKKGIAFFKQKWGGIPFLNHEFVLYETSRAGIIDALLGRL